MLKYAPLKEKNGIKRIWEKWKSSGVKPALTYLELNHIAKHVNTTCEELDADPQEIDLQSLLDATLDYYENLNFVDMQLKQLNGHFSYDFEEIGTEKLREKYKVLMQRYRKQKVAILKLRKRNKRLKNRLNPKKPSRRKRRKTAHQVLCSK